MVEPAAPGCELLEATSRMHSQLPSKVSRYKFRQLICPRQAKDSTKAGHLRLYMSLHRKSVRPGTSSVKDGETEVKNVMKSRGLSVKYCMIASNNGGQHLAIVMNSILDGRTGTTLLAQPPSIDDVPPGWKLFATLTEAADAEWPHIRSRPT
eukprot:CAMPEP_0176096374 /NCGR_PEP_ID=MMETSP0120_2-20121206/48313_1 /TAXON_ID=160619 /ORGANISM="Kryptoperidinium foliaceum, Strain CCMP 1326" /LENGTH=151 /DNA_ID=CAMNT_0017430359 /DNA_START=50 /DNA_END=502 /DNA_ORIENTATION=-